MGAIDFFRDFVVWLESLAKMIQVDIAYLLNSEVINNEYKHDGASLVMPEAGGGGCLAVVKFGKAVLMEVVSKDACSGETIHVTALFEVDPGDTGKLVEFVFVNEFLGDVSKHDADVLWPVERGVEIENLEVHGGKPGISLQENTVDEQFYKFNRARGGTYISGIYNVVAANGDAHAVSVISLLRLDLANNIRVGDFPAVLGWDLVVQDGEEGVGAFDVLTIVGTSVNALA